MKKTLFLVICLFLGISFFAACESPAVEDEMIEKEIIMPKYESNYCGNERHLDDVVQELKSLGFTDIVTIPLSPGSSNYQSTGVESVRIYKNWLDGCVSFDKGDVFLSTSKVEIEYYDLSSVIVAEENPELKEYLLNSELTGREFVKKYGGEIIAFEGYITGRTTDISGNLVRYALTGAVYNKDLIEGIVFSTSIDSDWNIHHGLDSGDTMRIIGKVDSFDEQSRQVVYITAYYIGDGEEPYPYS